MGFNHDEGIKHRVDLVSPENDPYLGLRGSWVKVFNGSTEFGVYNGMTNNHDISLSPSLSLEFHDRTFDNSQSSHVLVNSPTYVSINPQTNVCPVREDYIKTLIGKSIPLEDSVDQNFA